MSDELNRRDFSRLTAAALGGMMAGTMAVSGCGKGNEGAKGPELKTAQIGDKHLCRGLNACKGQGASGKNDCAGAGDCATIGHHGCGGDNACKGQGGCGDTAGKNECKGKGGCSIPLMEHAWTGLREEFTKEYKAKAGKDPLAAPPEKK